MDYWSDKKIKWLNYSIQLLGVSLLLYQYVVNRSMWTDEAKLALNVMNHSFWELTAPLDHNQSAPILFLFFTKITTLVFGTSDYSFRLFPFLLGVFSIPLFSGLIFHVTKSKLWSLVGLLFFVTNVGLIYYSTEFKQYIGDLFVFLVLILLVTKLNEKNLRNTYLALGFLGATFIFLSNITPIVMVMGSLIIIFKRYSSIIKSTKEKWYLFSMVLLWSCSFLVFYFVVIHNNPLKSFMLEFWMFSFPPHPFNLTEFLTWLNDFGLPQLFTVFNIPQTIFIVLFSIAIIGNIISKNWKVTLLLLTPLVIHIQLAYLYMYPFYGRFLTYTIPILILFLIFGFIGLVNVFSAFPKTQKVITVVLILAPTILFTQNIIVNLPIQKEELRLTLEVVDANQQPNDLTYVYYGSLMSFKRYKSEFQNIKYTYGEEHRGENQKYIQDISKIIEENHSVWFVFSHIYPWGGEKGEDQVIYEYLEKNGVITHDQYFKGSRVYLYSKKP